VAKKIPRKTSSKFGPEKTHLTFLQNFVQSKTLLCGPLVAWFSKIEEPVLTLDQQF
jgi:hypothetical protein